MSVDYIDADTQSTLIKTKYNDWMTVID